VCTLKKIEHYRTLMSRVIDQLTAEGITKLIAKLLAQKSAFTPGKKHIVCCFLCIAIAGRVLAGEAQVIPKYLVERWCKEVAKAAGESEVICSGCIQEEQDACDGLKLPWTVVPVRRSFAR
jgi:hypothetical protein